MISIPEVEPNLRRTAVGAISVTESPIGWRGESRVDVSWILEVDAQGSHGNRRAGYLYGIDLYNEVFPATPGWRSGIQISRRHRSVFRSLRSTITYKRCHTPIDREVCPVSKYHGTVIVTFRVGRHPEPYIGVRVFGGSVNWQDNSCRSRARTRIISRVTRREIFRSFWDFPVRICQGCPIPVRGLLFE